jgi:hypothetical protein
MKEVTARIEMLAGQRFDAAAFTKVAYDPYERAVIFSDTKSEIRLDPHCVRDMISQLTAFANVLDRLGVKTDRA